MTVARGFGALPLRAWVAALLVVAVFVAAVVWFRGADEHRVGAACETWLSHRDALRTALSETEEAYGRAAESDGDDVSRHYNDLGTTISSLERWEAVGPSTRDELHEDIGASALERGAASAFDKVNAGVTQLRVLILEGDAIELSGWVPEFRARMQIVDDACGAAWRS